MASGTQITEKEVVSFILSQPFGKDWGVVPFDLSPLATEADRTAALTFKGKERKVRPFCHPEKSGGTRGLCDMCKERMRRDMRAGKLIDPVSLAIYSGSELREVVRRRLVAAVAAAVAPEDYVRAMIRYEPGSGFLYWKASPANHAAAGDVCGSKSTRYWMVDLLGKNTPAHRIAWLLQTGAWPEGEIDHVNRDGFDNRWVNLRIADRFQNMWNRKLPSPTPGVHFHKQSGKWRAKITVRGKYYSLGLYSDKAEAVRVRDDAAKRLHGEFARLSDDHA